LLVHEGMLNNDSSSFALTHALRSTRFMFNALPEAQGGQWDTDSGGFRFQLPVEYYNRFQNHPVLFQLDAVDMGGVDGFSLAAYPLATAVAMLEGVRYYKSICKPFFPGAAAAGVDYSLNDPIIGFASWATAAGPVESLRLLTPTAPIVTTITAPTGTLVLRFLNALDGTPFIPNRPGAAGTGGGYVALTAMVLERTDTREPADESLDDLEARRKRKRE